MYKICLLVFLGFFAFGQNNNLQNNAQAIHTLAPTPISEQWYISLGLGVGFFPEYEGATEKEAIPFPLFEFSYGRFSLSLSGFQIDLARKFSWDKNIISRFGIQFAFDLGRDEDDNIALKGLGDIEPNPTFGFYYETTFGFMNFSLNAIQAIGGSHEGFIVDISASTFTPLIGDKLALFLEIGTSYGSKDYNQAYFGITNNQANNSNFSAYAIRAGTYKWSINASFAYRITDNWSTLVGIESSKYLNDIANSPLILENNPISYTFGFNYKY